jgi:hypothetical protein
MNRGSALCLAGLTLAGLFLSAAAARAHEQKASYVTLTLSPQHLEVEVAYRPSDLQSGFALDANGDGVLDPGELAAGSARVFAVIEQEIRVSADFVAVPLKRRESRLGADESGRPLGLFRMGARLERMPAEMSVATDFTDRLGNGHLYLVKVVDGPRVQQAVLTADHPQESFVVSGEHRWLAQIGQFTKLGIEHIFLGYDHILFLLALIVVGGRLRDLVKIVTAFTVAHSATLILAALGVVRLPPRLIECGVALTIVYVAAENFWVKNSDHRWHLTLMFGLVHGLGFANVLRDLGLPSRGLVSSLLAFNIGVEIGQICIVALFFPLTLWLARQSFQRAAVLTASSLILLAGLGWFIERAFGLAFMPL